MSYKPYGTDPKMDKLVDSPIIDERISAALEGYGLDVLVNDADYEVREAVAKNCNGNLDILNKLVNDSDEWVRVTALEQIERYNLSLSVSSDIKAPKRQEGRE